MHLESLSVLGFRNLKPGPVALSEGLNLICGENGQGKTNFLEAVLVCATARSPRTRQDRELIAFGEAEAHLQAVVVRESGSRARSRIDVHLKRENKKGLAINGLGLHRSGELFGVLHTVSFFPADLQLVQGGPALRRRFLDLELCQLSRVYVRALQQYYQVLKHRNALLKQLRLGSGDRSVVLGFDEQLAYWGQKITHSRAAFVAELNEAAAAAHDRLSGGREILRVTYRKSCDEGLLLERLQGSLDRDILLGQTSFGPHRDDLEFFLNEQEARAFGSQGQQRTAALSVKLAELSLVQEQLGEGPVLLLDDVLSELDSLRQGALWALVGQVQTLLTCTTADQGGLAAAPQRTFWVRDGVFAAQDPPGHNT